MRLYFYIATVVLFTTTIQAQSIITDRPDQTESSSTIPKGSFQIETGVSIGTTEFDMLKELELILPTLLLRYGLTESIELRLAGNMLSVKDQTTEGDVLGFSDLEPGVKIQLLRKEDVNIEIAFLSHLVIPTGTNEFSNKQLGSINKLSFSHSLSNKIGLGYNLGYDYFGTGKGILTYSLALGYTVSDKIGIYVEPYGYINELVNHIASFDGGVTYLLKDNLQLDLSLGTGLNHNMKYLAVGLSWNFSR